MSTSSGINGFIDEYSQDSFLLRKILLFCCSSWLWRWTGHKQKVCRKVVNHNDNQIEIFQCICWWCLPACRWLHQHHIHLHIHWPTTVFGENFHYLHATYLSETLFTTYTARYVLTPLKWFLFIYIYDMAHTFSFFSSHSLDTSTCIHIKHRPPHCVLEAPLIQNSFAISVYLVWVMCE